MIFGFSACTKEQAEKESVSDAYTFFINWAVSGGANYTNWYENIAGYRNTNKIY